MPKRRTRRIFLLATGCRRQRHDFADPSHGTRRHQVLTRFLLEQIAEVVRLRVRRSSQERTYLEDFLQRLKRRTVVIVDAVAVGRLTTALGKRRKQKHANRAIAEGTAVLAFIPDDEH